ncbi:MAG: hypothetical protein D6725_00980 [Planctomycetota bacterium]|nr:MAG: hypothetical protein D6725_00980 [Planctomycetota bacterium]
MVDRTLHHRTALSQTHRNTGWAAAALLFALAAPAAGLAQSPRNAHAADSAPRRTEVVLEIVTDRLGSNVAAQEWGRLMQRFGYEFHMRRSPLAEKPSLRETTFGRLRRVTVQGRLDTLGRLIMPNGKTYTLPRADKLIDWLRELELYGAQGRPKNDASFGFTKAQLSRIAAALANPVATDLSAETLAEALKKLQLSPSLPVVVDSRAAAAWRQAGDTKVGQSFRGIAKGTALAAMLGNVGLAFRPWREPDGRFVLQIVLPEPDRAVWPIGRPVQGLPRDVAPQLYQFIDVELNDVPLRDVLDAVALKTGVPIIYDFAAIEEAGADLSEKISFGPKRTTWSLFLKSVTNPRKLTRLYRLDDAGRPFVLITSIRRGVIEPSRAARSRK